MRHRALLLLTLVISSVAPSALALPSSAEPVVVALPGAWLTGYATPATAAQVGGTLGFVNADVMTHSVIAVAYGAADRPWCDHFPAGRCPLFYTPTIGIGAVEVQGLDQLEAGGVYDYYCLTHMSMRGKLVALPAEA